MSCVGEDHLDKGVWQPSFGEELKCSSKICMSLIVTEVKGSFLAIIIHCIITKWKIGQPVDS